LGRGGEEGTVVPGKWSKREEKDNINRKKVFGSKKRRIWENSGKRSSRTECKKEHVKRVG